MEKDEDQKKRKRPLDLNWDMIYPKNENGPPAEVVVVGGQVDVDKTQKEINFIKEATDHQLQEKIGRLEGLVSCSLKLPDKGEKLIMNLNLHKQELERRNQLRKVNGGQVDVDKTQKEINFIKEATDYQLQEKIGRLKGLVSCSLKLPDKGEKLIMNLNLHKQELERRNQLRKEAEGEKSRQSRSMYSPGACNSNGSEGPSQAHSKSNFFSSFSEHLDNTPDLSTRISVNPVSKKLSLVNRDNHQDTSSKGLLLNNGRREIRASTKISPSQRPRISDRDGHEHTSSLGARNTIDSSSFYRPLSDRTFSGRSSKRRKTSPVQASKQSQMKEFYGAVDVSKKRETVVLLDEDDFQLTETIHEENETVERKEAKIYYPSRDDPECVEVHYSDIKCLAPEAFLSSTIMNFYIRYLQRPVSATGKSRSDNHFFSTYFYGKVKEAASSKKNDKVTLFSKLRRWWKGVNIFEKAYILLPINEDYHWSLVIICLPKKEDEAGPIILHLDSLGYHCSSVIFQNIKSFLKEEWEYLNQSGRPLNLLIADKIWKHLDRRIDEKRITVPQQKNDYDCGIFVLYFMERFIEDAPERLSKKDLDMFGSKWFKPEDASCLRERIRNLLKEEFDKPAQDIPKESSSSSDPDSASCSGSLQDS